jgi:hypothetical protein
MLKSIDLMYQTMLAELGQRSLDHDVFRSGRPKNMKVIDSNRLERMRAENRTHLSSSRSRRGMVCGLSLGWSLHSPYGEAATILEWGKGE